MGRSASTTVARASVRTAEARRSTLFRPFGGRWFVLNENDVHEDWGVGGMVHLCFVVFPVVEAKVWRSLRRMMI